MALDKVQSSEIFARPATNPESVRPLQTKILLHPKTPIEAFGGLSNEVRSMV